MSWKAKVISFFPTVFYLLVLVGMNILICKDFLIGLIFLSFILYILPVIIFRLHNLFFPLKEGKTDLTAPSYSPWYGSYCLQRIYHDLPFLESVLRSIPGCYGLWLRLWGAKVGKNVHWTPNIQILDRSFIEIGDNVFFGHEVGISSHMVSILDGKEILGLYPVKVGLGSFIGAKVELFPGATILPNTSVNYKTVVGFKETYPHA